MLLLLCLAYAQGAVDVEVSIRKETNLTWEVESFVREMMVGNVTQFLGGVKGVRGLLNASYVMCVGAECVEESLRVPVYTLPAYELSGRGDMGVIVALIAATILAAVSALLAALLVRRESRRAPRVLKIPIEWPQKKTISITRNEFHRAPYYSSNGHNQTGRL
jgi:hypothetical protein